MLKQFFSELKFKDWSLIALLCVSIIFSVNYFLSSSGYKKEINKLETEYEDIQKQRDDLDAKNKKLKIESQVYIDKIKFYKTRIDSIEKLISRKDTEIDRLKITARNFKSSYEKTKKEIEKLEKEPIKRVGDDLLNSLKEKTTKNE